MSQHPSEEKKSKRNRLLILLLLTVAAGAGVLSLFLNGEKSSPLAVSDTTRIAPQVDEEIEPIPLDSEVENKDTVAETNTLPLPDKKTPRVGKKKESVKKDTVVAASDPCAGVMIRAKILTNSSPWDADAGTIQIDNRSLKGGTAPYSFSVDSSAGFNKFTLIHKVKPGTYSVFIKDHTGCITEVSNVTVEKDPCTSKYVSSFSPSTDGIWKLPLPPGMNGSVSIYSSKGKQIFAKEKVSDLFAWDGKTSSGELAQSGIYRVVVEYPRLKSCTVALTIMK